MLLGLEIERARRQGTNQAHPTAASPETSKANPKNSPSTLALDDSPVRRYSSRQQKIGRLNFLYRRRFTNRVSQRGVATHRGAESWSGRNHDEVGS